MRSEAVAAGVGYPPPVSLGRAARRAGRYAAVAVFSLHAGAMLLTGLPPVARDLVWPAIGWYADGLLMTNRWGMFSRPPRNAEVLVVAHAPGGRERLVETSLQTSRRPLRRFVDARMRKILGNLARPAHRDHRGAEALAYFCRIARRDDPSVVRVVLKERPVSGTDARAGLGDVLLTHRCGDAPRGTGRSAPPDTGDGDT